VVKTPRWVARAREAMVVEKGGDRGSKSIALKLKGLILVGRCERPAMAWILHGVTPMPSGRIVLKRCFQADELGQMGR